MALFDLLPFGCFLNFGCSSASFFQPFATGCTSLLPCSSHETAETLPCSKSTTKTHRAHIPEFVRITLFIILLNLQRKSEMGHILSELCYGLQDMRSETLQNRIEAQMMCGRNIFTKEDVKGLGVHSNKDSLKKALYRVQEKGIIISLWQNFYVAAPMEYRLKGEMPPSFYIDHLMRFVGRDYYVSLLSAAMLNGAGHQLPHPRPQLVGRISPGLSSPPLAICPSAIVKS